MLLRRLAALAIAAVMVGLCGAGRAAEPDAKLVPADADFVLVANYQQLVNSAMFKKHGMEPFKQALQDPEIKGALDALGLDPLKDIDTVVVTNSGKLDSSGNLFVAVKGRFDLDKIAAAAKNEGLKVHKDGGLTVYETKAEKGSDPVFITFPDKNTLVLSPKKDYLVNVLTGKVKPGASAKDLKDALAKANARDTIYFGLVITPALRAELKKNPQVAPVADKLSSVTGSVNVTDAAQVDLLINTKDQKTAGELSMTIKQTLPLLKVLLKNQEDIPPVVIDLIDRTKVGTNDASVTIGVKITDDLVEKALKGK